MWLLLNSNVSKKFIMQNGETYLIKLDKTNFFVGKNNSGKSYFIRFLLSHAIKFYKNNKILIEDIKQVISNEKSVDFDFYKSIKNEEIRKLYSKFNNYILLLNKINTEKIDKQAKYIDTNIAAYSFKNENSLLNELEPLFDYLKIKNNIYNLNVKVIHNYKSIFNGILIDFQEQIIKTLSEIANLEEEDIIRFGIKLSNLDEIDEIDKYYFPIMRNIRHPLKSVNSLYDDNSKNDIYKERIVSEYGFSNNINVVTGLNFYQDYKNCLLGSKDKREKINKFEKFLSEYFFNGQSVAIIPDEVTFELKININNENDQFIYQVGDGITSLLIIMYTVFMESSDEYKLFFIEEPENSFHPGFQRLFINMITYYKEFENCIFIIATHSNHLIDIGNRENKNCIINLCKKEKNRISIYEKNEEFNDVIDELGVTPTSVLIANKAIWVEGKYDAFYIRLLLNLKNINNEKSKKYIEDYDYCFIPYGGKNISLIDFNPKIDEEYVKEFIVKAKKVNPNYKVILDDDNMFENNKKAKIKEYKKLYEELHDRVYKLKVREIENLFPKEVVEMYIRQGIKEKYATNEIINDLRIDYDEYKDKKLGDYINNKLLNSRLINKNNRMTINTITGRKDGFIKNGFLYDKLKFYKCVLEWSRKSGFNYEKDVSDEAKDLINSIEVFIQE